MGCGPGPGNGCVDPPKRAALVSWLEYVPGPVKECAAPLEKAILVSWLGHCETWWK